jgi:hypothetical protein
MTERRTLRIPHALTRCSLCRDCIITVLMKSLKVAVKTTVRAWKTKQILYAYSSPDCRILTSVETFTENRWNSAVD